MTASTAETTHLTRKRPAHSLYKLELLLLLRKLFAVIRYPYQMILKPMFGMHFCMASGHSQIMPDFPPLRQLSLASFQVPFILCFESQEFSG